MAYVSSPVLYCWNEPNSFGKRRSEITTDLKYWRNINNQIISFNDFNQAKFMDCINTCGLPSFLYRL